MAASDPLRIEQLEAFQVPVRLKTRVQHASFSRTHNDTLIVRCLLSDGSVGWGEGLPRTYVTGESIESVWRHLRSTDFSRWAGTPIHHPQDAVDLTGELPLANVAADEGVIPRACFGNVVRCAVELSVLDAVGRAWRVSAADILAGLPAAKGLIERVSEVRYSGVATASRGLRQWRSALKMKLFGFRQVKVKVGADGVDDVSFLRRMRRLLGAKVDLRLDANEAWQPHEVIDRVNRLAAFGISSVEQPVRHADVGALTGIRSQLSVPVMLDESLCCQADAEQAVASSTCDAFNLRISKCGGLVACIQLAQFARQHGLGYQLGCQVGETGILSAAGRALACTLEGIRYLEGSYDGFLVADRLTKENLTIRYGGRGPRLTGPGLGVTVDEDRVRQLAEDVQPLL